ncbi:ABC transporter ATP-binding protein [Paenibacillus sp. KACC 21273]|uniref:ABC transporter ATP-binding protein n=1 Tax=Paenibacillus sp. KACC 21273 TaxID=3025665 RepID=UPI0023652D62|nr:ABC transporter ATP-binding protein [Paenibacillus sp. KACC 21273]WDF49977.1 ABC transporter ATP-binding protein [Paenibacillus sp. KACC 21273]
MKDRSILTDYVQKHWRYYLLAVSLIILSNIGQAAIPRVLGQFTDALLNGGIQYQMIIEYSVILAVIGIMYNLFFGAGQFTVMRLGRKFEFEMRQSLFSKFSTLSEYYFSKQGTGKLLSSMTNDVNSVRESISNGVTMTTNAIFLFLSCIVMMLLSHIPLYLILVSVIPMVGIPFLVIYFGPRIRKRSQNVQESLAVMTESAEEQLSGIRVTKTFAIEPTARQRFGTTVNHIRDNQLHLVRMSSLFQAAVPFLGALSLVISLLYGGYLTIQGTITIGNFIALTLYLRIMSGPLQQIGNVINMMQRSGASLDRVNRLLAEKPDIEDHPNAQPLASTPDLKIKHLSFAYPGSERYALSDINLHIEAGQTVGIVGKTGSGKSTLVKLLLRLYDPPENTVWLGGTDIRQISLQSLRSRIAYVPQDGFLFSTTIRDNIAFSDRDTPLEKVEDHARQAMIYDPISNFPEGFDTKLGERGITLSGGQRQRTSLARGLVKKGPILILDDSMSAVDAVTETGILNNLIRERNNYTNLIISHRISAVKHADLIIVLDEGTIVQQGTHQQLLQQQGIYSSLYQLQEEGLRA